MKILKMLYNGIIWGLLTAVIAFKSTWLEMRMNIGYIIPLLMIAVLIVGFLIGVIRQEYKFIDRMGFGFSMVNLIISSIIAITILGLDRIAVVPAAIVREGIKATGISFPIINTIIVIILLLGAVVLAIGEKGKKVS